MQLALVACGRGPTTKPRKAHHGWVRPKNTGESAQGNVRGTNVMRILVAFEDDYRAYADALAKDISAARPHLDVATVGLEAPPCGSGASPSAPDHTRLTQSHPS
jgi:hypothetical protein